MNRLGAAMAGTVIGSSRAGAAGDLPSGSKGRADMPAVSARVHLNCPRCGLTITPRVGWLGSEHCPRCLARRRVAVPLFASTLPTSELYASGAVPAESRTGQPAGRRI